jgi:serine/threonine-protein kinase
LVLMLLAGPAAADGFGAIAYSPATGQWGWAQNYATRFGAEWRALQECRSAVGWGQDCRLGVVVRNACAALATGAQGWGAGQGQTPAQAAAAALASCRGQTRGCTVQLRVCSG